MRKTYDVVGLGEFLVDLLPVPVLGGEGLAYEPNAGGAPLNVLAGLAKFGRRTALISKIGNDHFGRFLEAQMANIDKRGLRYTDAAPTTLAFVHLAQNGERSFTFYRNPGADTLLTPDEVDSDLIAQAAVFHFGSLSMTVEPTRAATMRALDIAKSQGTLISYDPNLRSALWSNLEEARAAMLAGLAYADVLKVSEEELTFLTELDNPAAALDQLARTDGLKAIFVTLGPHGCRYRVGSKTGLVPGYAVPAIDTTGAGDAFMSAILHSVLAAGKPLEDLAETEIVHMCSLANAVGALTTTAKGAVKAIPSLEAAEALRHSV